MGVNVVVIDVCGGKVEKAGYYEIYKQNFVVSRQTFANLLKKLEKEGIVSRKTIENRPPRVEYSLTEKGKRNSRYFD